VILCVKMIHRMFTGNNNKQTSKYTWGTTTYIIQITKTSKKIKHFVPQLFQMTQLINRNNTKSHHAKSNQLSVEIRIHVTQLQESYLSMLTKIVTVSHRTVERSWRSSNQPTRLLIDI